MSQITRFTPTRVGTTTASIAHRPTASVHPHARGDNFEALEPGGKLFGSPPRAWGQLRRDGRAEQQVRFTPTRVGTTRVG